MSKRSDFKINNNNPFHPGKPILERYKGKDREIEIPEGISTVASYAFNSCDEITKITVPDSLESISKDAFKDSGEFLADEQGFCMIDRFLINYVGSEEIVHVPDGVKIIDIESFGYNNTIRKVYLPASLKIIKSRAFWYCDNLEEVIFADDANEFEVIENSAFKNCPRLHYVNFPKSVTYVGGDAFAGSDKFLKANPLLIAGSVLVSCNDDSATYVEIPEGVKRINNHAFYRHPAIEEVILPNGLEIIENDAFRESSLSKISIPSSVKLISRHSFYATNISEIVIPEGGTYVYWCTFTDCKRLEKVVLPSTIKTIESLAFSGCSKLKEINLPENLTFIGKQAFKNCSRLERVTIPASVETIEEGAFDGVNSMRNADSLKRFDQIIVDGALKKYQGDEKEITVREGVTRIESNALDYLSIVHLPDSVREINEGYFRGLKYMNIPDGYLRQQTKLSAKATVELMEGVWKEQATLEDYAALYVFQGGKAFTEICYPKLEKDYNKTTDAFIEVLRNATKASAFKNAAQFLIDHPYAIKNMILQEKKNALYLLVVNAKAKEAAELLSPYVDLKNSDTKAADEKKPDKVITDADIKISGTTLTVSDGVAIIPAGTVTFNKRISEIVLPDSVKMIYEDDGLAGIKVNLPSGYLKTQEKLPDKFTSTLLVDQWRKQAGFDDYAALYLYQGGKCLKELSLCELKWSPDEGAKAMMRVLSESGRSKDYPKAAEFFYTYHTAIQNDTIQKMHDLAVSVKSKKAIEIVDPIIGAGLSGSAPVKKEVEIYCHDHFSEYALSRSTIFASSSEWDGSVKYKDSDEIAPGYVVQCAVAPYINMVFNNEALKICKEADHVAKELDRESLIAALNDRNSGSIWKYINSGIAAYCRYADGRSVQKLIAQINKGRKDKSERKTAEHAASALVLSDTREAMIFFDKEGRLNEYARFRNLKPDDLRNKDLGDFGLDENGKKLFDIGSTVIELSINNYLQPVLYDKGAEKEIKSIPKQGADEHKYNQAKEEFEDIKKNLKSVIKRRNELLFKEYLDEKAKYTPSEWASVYLDNYIYHKVAELLVWVQDKKTFILGANGPIDYVGRAFEISDNSPIRVAHPMEMEIEEISAWQKHFVFNNLRQPFEQVWEPVINPSDIKSDRYRGILIPYYRFAEKENIGIHAYDDHYHDISISFEKCRADVISGEWLSSETRMEHRFEIENFELKEHTRKTNHLITYLDRITAYEKVGKDDISVMSILDYFTVAQIMDFIRIASDKKANNVLAGLMDYKNTNFTDFDPMDEFVLD